MGAGERIRSSESIQAGEFSIKHGRKSSINLAAGLVAGPALFWLKAGQLAWNGYGLFDGARKLWNADNKGDEEITGAQAD